MITLDKNIDYYASLCETKEDALKILDNDIIEAFKQFSGERIPGGEGDCHKIEEFDMEQLYKGVMTEMEHTHDINYALEITIDHLVEHPFYYQYLEKMEKEMETDLANKQHPK